MASQRAMGLLLMLLIVMGSAVPGPAEAKGRKGGGGGGGLNPFFYRRTCPQFSNIVNSNIRKWLTQDVKIAPMLVRLLFHDAVVHGVDASIMINGTNTEKNAIPNRSLNGFFVIDDIKAQLEAVCPGVVSCSDILVTAVRDAIFQRQGPFYTVSLGRRDGVVTDENPALAATNNPSPNLFADGVLAVFQTLGLGAKDAVALSGAHTLGKGACGAFRRRFTNFNGTGLPDPKLPPSLLASLVANCSDPAFRVDLDRSTPTFFDNKYFTNLVAGFGIFTSDQYLLFDPITGPIVRRFAFSQGAFFAQFKASITALSNLGVLTGTQGQIRTNCAVVNTGPAAPVPVVAPAVAPAAAVPPTAAAAPPTPAP